MGRHLLPGPPPEFQVIPVTQSGRETPGARASKRTDPGAAIQALAGARWRQAVSEVSLPPVGQAALALSGAGEAAREMESKFARDRAGGGSGRFGRRELSKREQRRGWRTEGGRGGCRVMWERVMWERLMWQLLQN